MSMVEEKQEVRCPECSAVFKNFAGLSGHRQFKHGVKPSKQPRLELDPLDRLVTESRLEQALEQVLDQVLQLRNQVSDQADRLEQVFNVLRGETILGRKIK